ncbi:MAG: hypothetical protein FWD17_06495, partial [Polyangiaceae bacterium]|nr:hypothetical protein [Polyangiaceae bacterium]
SRGFNTAAGVAAHPVAGPLAALTGVASVTVPIVSGAFAIASIEAGGALAGTEARADGRTVAGTGGAVLGAQAGLGYRF